MTLTSAVFNRVSEQPTKCRSSAVVHNKSVPTAVAYPGILFGRGSTNSVEGRENGDLEGGSPLVRGSGGSCNLVQEISFPIVKFS